MSAAGGVLAVMQECADALCTREHVKLAVRCNGARATVEAMAGALSAFVAAVDDDGEPLPGTRWYLEYVAGKAALSRYHGSAAPAGDGIGPGGTVEATTDDDLPGMWERADFIDNRDEQPAAPAGGGAEDRFVPGVMHCAKCKFRLVRTNLYVGNGTTGAGDNKTEPCPNGCGPLWPVTWEQEAREGWKLLDDMHGRLASAGSAPAPSADARDAARYRWLRDNCVRCLDNPDVNYVGSELRFRFNHLRDEKLGDAIDAAMSAAPTPEQQR